MPLNNNKNKFDNYKVSSSLDIISMKISFFLSVLKSKWDVMNSMPSGIKLTLFSLDFSS